MPRGHKILDRLAASPTYSFATVEKQQLKDILLHSGGIVYVNGYRWKIISEHLGVGVYKIYLEKDI
jgi:hypothetical protein